MVRPTTLMVRPTILRKGKSHSTREWLDAQHQGMASPTAPEKAWSYSTRK